MEREEYLKSLIQRDPTWKSALPFESQKPEPWQFVCADCRNYQCTCEDK
jgi:hypothetical protein